MNLAACLLEVVEEVKNMCQENKSFPSNKLEALAFLHVEKLNNVSSLAPEGLLNEYNEGYERLRKADAENPQRPIEMIR